ncbi:MAG: sulfite oxidase [Acidobacteria bacterium]|nr:sulfite oxidase [Acidobacteriota bacterium]
MTSNDPACRNAGLIVRENQPTNLESPFDHLNGLITPNHLFYVRNHFPVPLIDGGTHELTVSGAVQRPFAIQFEELRAMPAETRAATMECAGNSRVFLPPPVDGVQWQLGAIGTAEWTGVPLSALLDRAGLNDRACEVVFEGADHGKAKEKPAPHGEIRYARSIPVGKAADVLIAYAMNGEDLSPEHGYPLRAVVPGHYGMASVKWLTAIRVTTKPFQGYFQTTDYAYWDEDGTGSPERVPLGEMSLKSQIARPRIDEGIAAGSCYRVFGAAWSEGTVESVGFSDDDGKTWREARLLDPEMRGVWRRWEYEWRVPSTPGIRILKSRARDFRGNVQPDQHDKRFGTYVINHVLPVRVMIRS